MRRVLNMHSMDSLAEEEEYVNNATRHDDDEGEGDDDEEEMPPEARMWRSVVDPSSGKPYYYHSATRESQWEKPLVLCSARERAEVLRRGEQERYFFAEMECNIRRKIQQGLLFDDPSRVGASLPSTDDRSAMYAARSQVRRTGDPGSNAEGQSNLRSPNRLWRTISTLDVSLLFVGNNSCALFPIVAGLSKLYISSPSPARMRHQSRKAYIFPPSFIVFSPPYKTPLPLRITVTVTIRRTRAEHRVAAELCASSPFARRKRSSAIATRKAGDFEASLHSPNSNGGSSDSCGGDGSSPPSLAPLAPAWTASCPAVPRRLADGETPSPWSGTSHTIAAAGATGPGAGKLSAAGELAGEGVRFRERGFGDVGMVETAGVHGSGRTGARPLHHLPPHLVRRNSTSTVHIADNDTMSDPDLDATIRCVCAVLRAHMIEAVAKGQEGDHQRGEELGLQGHGMRGGAAPDTQQQWVLERVTLFNDSPHNPSISDAGENGSSLEGARATSVPSLREITSYFRHLYHRARLKFDCIVVSLIYVERLMKETRGALRPLPCNWKSLVMSVLLLASKVWDDHSMWNRDFSELCPAFTLVRLNQLEVAMLELLRFNVKVLSSEYAKYYFHLRSMCVRGGLSVDHAPIPPFDMEGVRVLEDFSSKLEMVSGGQGHHPEEVMPSHGVNDARLLQKVAMSGYAFAGKYAPHVRGSLEHAHGARGGGNG
ncbi:unnamed protein product [Ascophyllum nodosum]